MNSNTIVSNLKKHQNLNNIKGMSRFGINTQNALGISLPYLRSFAKKIGKNHNLAVDLWKTKVHEARILATLIDDHKLVTEEQMNEWVNEFDSWDLCDQCCNNLFRKTSFAINKSFQWISDDKEFVRRAGFVLAAVLSVHDKEMNNNDFIKYFPLIEKYSTDDRNLVKKSVNWALRQIGKRNIELNKEAIKICVRLIKSNSKSAKWIGKDALNELTSVQVETKLTKNK